MRIVLNIGDRYSDITGETSNQFADELRAASETPGITELVLNMDGIRTISSVALGALFNTFQVMKALRLINASPNVIRLLRMVNMTELINE
jgi:anti-anti-sigma factor